MPTSLDRISAVPADPGSAGAQPVRPRPGKESRPAATLSDALRFGGV